MRMKSTQVNNMVIIEEDDLQTSAALQHSDQCQYCCWCCKIVVAVFPLSTLLHHQGHNGFIDVCCMSAQQTTVNMISNFICDELNEVWRIDNYHPPAESSVARFKMVRNGQQARAWNEGYPKFTEDLTITEKAHVPYNNCIGIPISLLLIVGSMSV